MIAKQYFLSQLHVMNQKIDYNSLVSHNTQITYSKIANVCIYCILLLELHFPLINYVRYNTVYRKE